jgi:beta-ribofuranosylaminobenzene 5'-phosphate synthase
MMGTVVVKAFPRLHATLIDLGDATYRRYGGAGFALARPETEVTVSLGSEDMIHLPSGLEDRDREDVLAVISRVVTAAKCHFRVSVSTMPPLHVGYGSKTALVLAIAGACAEAAQQRMTPKQLQRLSGRGGTSGIGVNAFFTGGFLVDMGHAAEKGQPWAPSASSRASAVPEISVHRAIPDDWVFHLFLPRGVSYRAGGEVDMFRRNTPIPRSEVLDIMAAVHHGLVPAVAHADLALLKNSLADIHATGFKQRELAAQSSDVRDLFCRLGACDEAAVGMSSMGPLLYAVTHRSSAVIGELLAVDLGIAKQAYLGASDGRNTGYEVQRGNTD